MSTARAFDHNISTWIAGQATPWARLRFRLAHANLRRHLDSGPLRVVDVGGGNGGDAIPLALDGHEVTIVDFSEAMLAEAQLAAADAGVAERITLLRSDVSALPDVVAAGSFDVVLCHNVLQYSDDVAALLETLRAPLRVGGLLSVMSTNRYAESYRAAFQHDDLATALDKLDRREGVAAVFDVPIRRFGGEELVSLIRRARCRVIGHYGVRCVCDYLPDNDRKADAAYFAQLEALELAMGATYPYFLLARFFQLIAVKQPDDAES